MTCFGFGLPEMFVRMHIKASRSWRRDGAGLCASERYERTKRALAYAEYAEARLISIVFLIGEAYDRILKAIGINA
jgi:hypothetical protein